jgi:hypothetical protein
MVQIHIAFVQAGDQRHHAVLSIPSSVDNQGPLCPFNDIRIGGFERTTGQRNVDSIKIW